MEKRSEYYLTKEARQTIYNLPWYYGSRQGSKYTEAHEALLYAESRKGKLVGLKKLQEQRGLLVSLKRFQKKLDLEVDGFFFKACYCTEGNFDSALEVDKIVTKDLGKVGSH